MIVTYDRTHSAERRSSRRVRGQVEASSSSTTRLATGRLGRRRRPASTFVQRAQRGFAAGVNVGLALGGSPYVLLLNPDACLPTGPRAVRARPRQDPQRRGRAACSSGSRRTCRRTAVLDAVSTASSPSLPLTRRWRYGRLGPEYPRAAVRSGSLSRSTTSGVPRLLRATIPSNGSAGSTSGSSSTPRTRTSARGARQSGMPCRTRGAGSGAHVGGVSSPGDEGSRLARLGHALAGLEKWTAVRRRWPSRRFRAVLVAPASLRDLARASPDAARRGRSRLPRVRALLAGATPAALRSCAARELRPASKAGISSTNARASLRMPTTTVRTPSSASTCSSSSGVRGSSWRRSGRCGGRVALMAPLTTPRYLSSATLVFQKQTDVAAAWGARSM